MQIPSTKIRKKLKPPNFSGKIFGGVGLKGDFRASPLTSRPHFTTSLHDRRNRAVVAPDADDERLGRPEAQEHIEAHGDVVLVVGDVEIDHATVFPIVKFHIGELQAAVFHAVVALDFRFSTIHDARGVAAVAVDHLEVDDVAFFPVFRVEGACAHEHRNHVEDAIFVAFPKPVVRAVGVQPVLSRMRLAVFVFVEHLIHVVALALAGALAVVERGEVERGIAQERVAEDEIVIYAFVAARGERGAPGGLSLVGALHGGHAGRAGLHPHEFPVVVEVVGQVFARLEGRVLERALRRERQQRTLYQEE